MNKIYLTCRMKVRELPSIHSKVVRIAEKNQLIEITEITPEHDGYVWFRVEDGYIANVEEVFLHSERYFNDEVEDIKKFINDFLDKSMASTEKSIKFIKDSLDKY